LASFFPLPGQHLRFDIAGCAEVQVHIH
jgi:hypothetical protein